MPSFDAIVTHPGLLAQGDATSTGAPSRAFDLVVLCAEEYQPHRGTFPSTTRIVYAPIDDAVLSPREAYTAEVASDVVARTLQAGRRALVTCMAGRNRSGLVSALSLCRLYGCSGTEAVAMVRARRPNALTNESFVDYLSRIQTRRRAT